MIVWILSGFENACQKREIIERPEFLGNCKVLEEVLLLQRCIELLHSRGYPGLGDAANLCRFYFGM
jgi:hypothetical protein